MGGRGGGGSRVGGKGVRDKINRAQDPETLSFSVLYTFSLYFLYFSN